MRRRTAILAWILSACLLAGCGTGAAAPAEQEPQAEAAAAEKAAEPAEEAAVEEAAEPAAEAAEEAAEPAEEKAAEEAAEPAEEEAAEEAAEPAEEAAEEEKETEGPLVPGTYTAEVSSVGGPFAVSVEVSADRIESIEVTECSDTRGVADAAIERLIPMMVENQTTNVDVVAGATLTSVFLRNAVSDALKQAGAGKEDFREAVHYTAEAQTDMETDIVVVGGGLAGMSAAAEAARSGRKVVLVEKLAYLGGDSLVSDQDCVNTFLPPVDKAFDEAVAALSESGVPIELADYPGYGENISIAVEETGDFDVMYKLVGHMREAAEKNGALFLLDTPATGLIVEDGAVKGVTAQPRGQEEFTIRAGAVILCTGGFSSNRDLVEQYLPYAVGARAMGLGANTGDALAWVSEIGAKTDMLDAADSSFMLANPRDRCRGILWN